MPSTSHKGGDDYDTYYDEYDEDYNTNENRWCQWCNCQEIFMNGLCECCETLQRVEENGVASFDNDYWMNSPCNTGIKLRESWKRLHVMDTTDEVEELPEPIYLSTDYERGTELMLLNPEKKYEIIKPKTKFSWDSHTPPKVDLQQTVAPTITNETTANNLPSLPTVKKTGSYVPPHRRN